MSGVDREPGEVAIGEWLDAQRPPVPPVFRPHLETSGPVSAATLLAAAEAAMRSCAERSPRDRAAAFSLLAADAHVTYACLRVLQEGGGSEELRGVTRRIGKIDVKWRE